MMPDIAVAPKTASAVTLMNVTDRANTEYRIDASQGYEWCESYGVAFEMTRS